MGIRVSGGGTGLSGGFLIIGSKRSVLGGIVLGAMSDALTVTPPRSLKEEELAWSKVVVDGDLSGAFGVPWTVAILGTKLVHSILINRRERFNHSR